jgi:hypothetical protein
MTSVDVAGKSSGTTVGWRAAGILTIPHRLERAGGLTGHIYHLQRGKVGEGAVEVSFGAFEPVRMS